MATADDSDEIRHFVKQVNVLRVIPTTDRSWLALPDIVIADDSEWIVQLSLRNVFHIAPDVSMLALKPVRVFFMVSSARWGHGFTAALVFCRSCILYFLCDFCPKYFTAVSCSKTGFVPDCSQSCSRLFPIATCQVAPTCGRLLFESADF
jgi:hypothetical protein